MRKILFLLFITTFSFNFAQATHAKKGTLHDYHVAPMKTLNYYTGQEAVVWKVWVYTGVRLTLDSFRTNEPQPYLAEKWEISADKKTYTFKINKKAVWHDGKPITAEDVKFTFDMLMDEKKCLQSLSKEFKGEVKEIRKVYYK